MRKKTLHVLSHVKHTFYIKVENRLFCYVAPQENTCNMQEHPLKMHFPHMVVITGLQFNMGSLFPTKLPL